MNGPVVALLALFCALAAGKNIEPFQRIPQKIVGGTQTTINNYPYATAMLYSGGWNTFSQSCGGTILTVNAILSAAHCYTNYNTGAAHLPSWWRIRVGSTQSSSGGQVHNIARVINHNQYNRYTYDYDLAVLRTATNIVYGASVARASIAGATYNLPDNSSVWAIGWGATTPGGSVVASLRHVQLWTVNQNTCNARYGGAITARMLCSGWLDVGGVDQCQGDSGGPLIHNGNIVGVSSWGNGCAQAYYPGVNTRVSSFANWIIQQS